MKQKRDDELLVEYQNQTSENKKWLMHPEHMHQPFFHIEPSICLIFRRLCVSIRFIILDKSMEIPKVMQ